MPSLLEDLIDYQRQDLSTEAIADEVSKQYAPQLKQSKWFKLELDAALDQGAIDHGLFESLTSLVTSKSDNETLLRPSNNQADITEFAVASLPQHPGEIELASPTSDVTQLSNARPDLSLVDVTRVSGNVAAVDSVTLVKPSDATRLSTSAAGAGVNQTDATRLLNNNEKKAQLAPVATGDSTDKTIFKPSDKKRANACLVKGSLIKNRFILVEDIGKGGMGTVFKARDLRKEEMHDDSPYVAIKFLNDDLRDQQDALIALQREAVKSQALAHPNIVTVYDFDRDADLVYLSMEYLEGKTLDSLIESQYCSRLPVQKVMHMIELIARGLAYAHQTGFAHADLKPSNIFLTNEGNIKVLDFGIAQAIRGANDHAPVQDSYFDVYSLGAITPNFASPEMLEDKVPTPADDMYSLGCVAYALLTGNHPFVDAKGNKISAKDARNSGLKIKTIPGLPRRDMKAINQCLNFEREYRYQNAGEFIDAIKPPAKLKRWVVGSLAGLSLAVILSWWITLEQSTVALALDDLPKEMSSLVATVKAADQSFKAGDIDQAHKLYSQVWEESFEIDQLDQRDQYKLKVIIDGRIDKVASFLIKESHKDGNDEFRLVQLQVALEFLQRGELGGSDEKIAKALLQLDEKIDSLSE